MGQVVEIDEHGAIQLPDHFLTALKPHTRFEIEIWGRSLMLRPVEMSPLWATVTPLERAAAVRRWAEMERPAAPPLSDTAVSREQMYD